MSIITKVLKQDAVYWPPVDRSDLGNDATHDDYGRPVLKCNPIQISVRWENVQEEIMSEAGATVIAKHKVMVSQDVFLRGFLWLGLLANAPDFYLDPRYQSDVFEIMKFEKIPNFRNTEYLRIAWL